MGILVLASLLGSRSAIADIGSGASTNAQEGDNESATDQSGEAQSGDAIAGQVTGSVSAGDTSIDATNETVGSSASSDDAAGANSASSFTGLTAGTDSAVLADIFSIAGTNIQEGSNSSEIVQAASAIGGDGVAGQIIGAVTSAGGSADIVAANTTEDSSAAGGSADAFNDFAGFTGLNATGTVIAAADIASASATNVQEGDNSLAADQSAIAPGGDGVAGQVIGTVSAGDASIDATNLTTGSDASGGASEADNFGAGFVGLTAATSTVVDVADIATASATNVQEGDNSGALVQAAEAPAGDAVSGQIAGVVTSAGGSADVVLANTSDGVSTGVGDAFIENFDAFATGLFADGVITVF
jgi:hypothetical protein